MITPSFDIRQDDDFVIVDIRVRHVRADDMDFYVLGEQFKCRPTGLRAHLNLNLGLLCGVPIRAHFNAHAARGPRGGIGIGIGCVKTAYNHRVVLRSIPALVVLRT